VPYQRAGTPHQPAQHTPATQVDTQEGDFRGIFTGLGRRGLLVGVGSIAVLVLIGTGLLLGSHFSSSAPTSQLTQEGVTSAQKTTPALATAMVQPGTSGRTGLQSGQKNTPALATVVAMHDTSSRLGPQSGVPTPDSETHAKVVSAPPAPPATRYQPYKEVLKSESSATLKNLWTYFIRTHTAELERGNKNSVDADVKADIEKTKPRFDTEAIDLFRRWIDSKMANASGPLPDAPKIKESAKQVVNLVGQLSYKRDPQTPDYQPSQGFLSGELVRFAEKNGEPVLVIGQFGSETVYNTRRLTEKQRVGKVVKEQVFQNLRALADCCKDTGAKHLAMISGYGYRDFGEEYASTEVEILGFVASLEDCHKFLDQDITQEEFLRRSEILIDTLGAPLKRIELTLE
jgi:hypothetical protein